ncbi:MAG: PLDc N-terminal domain-containing protein [Bacteroidota bacterium]
MDKEMVNNWAYLFLKQGFPILCIVVTGLALAAIWTDKKKGQSAKIMWTAIVVLFPVVGVAAYLIFGYR